LFLVKELSGDGVAIDEATVIRILNLHGAYVDGQIREAQAAAEAARAAAHKERIASRPAGKDAG